MLKTFDFILIGVMTATATVTYSIKHRAELKLEEVKRLESENGLEVYETTRDQVRRAFEAAGIVLLSTDKGEGVLLLHERDDRPAKR